MNKKWATSLLVLLILLPAVSHAQRWKLRRYEAMFGVGTSNFFGDIGGTSDKNNLFGFKDIQVQYTRPVFDVALRYKLSGEMAVKFSMIYGMIAGNDINSRNDQRNFAFRSTIFEPSLQFEYYILPEARGYSQQHCLTGEGWSIIIQSFTSIFSAE